MLNKQNNKMKNFINAEIEKVKDRKAGFDLQLSKEVAMVKSCTGVDGLEEMLEKAIWNVNYINEKQEHFDKMLDVFYTARDLKCECK